MSWSNGFGLRREFDMGYRRRHGSIWQRKDGRYSVALRMRLSDGTSVRKCFTVKTRAAAEDLLNKKLTMVKQGVPVPEREWRVGDFLDYWLAEVVPLKCRPRTVQLYETKIRIYIKPSIGMKRLVDLNARDVQALLNDAVATGNLRAAAQVKQVLRAALNRAMREELIVRNVATLTELPAPRPKRITPWNAEQTRRFIDGSKGHRWYLGYLLAVLYGLRRGEVMGLRWSDIDLEAGTIRVDQQVQWINGAVRPGPLKTESSRRTLPIIPITRQAIIDHFAQVTGAHRSAALLVQLQEGGTPLLAGPHGGYVGPDVFSNDFLKLAAELGLPRITVHILRHTAATNLKNLGVQARDVQLILGHAHVSTTQQLYQHADPEGQRAALTLVEDALLAVSDRSGSGQNWRSSQKISERIGDFVKTTSVNLGGPGGDRTRDILLKRFLSTPYRELPTPVHEHVRAVVIAYWLGAVAVKIGGQTPLRVEGLMSSDRKLGSVLEEGSPT